MVIQLSLVFLTVIHLSVAFTFQSVTSPVFYPKQANHASVENKEIQKAVSDLKEQKSRLEKQEQLISEHENVITEQANRLSKQRERLDQQMETLTEQGTHIKEQGERIDALNEVLSATIVSEKEEVVRLSNVEEKLRQLEAEGRVMKQNHGGNFTYLEEVGLSFALIRTTVQNSKMEEYCREMVEGGRLIVLDTKSKYEAMQDYLNEKTDEKTPFRIGLKKKSGEKIHHWSNGKPMDDNFWCTGPGKPHYSRCTALKPHPYQHDYCIGVIPCGGGRIICEKP